MFSSIESFLYRDQSSLSIGVKLTIVGFSSIEREMIYIDLTLNQYRGTLYWVGDPITGGVRTRIQDWHDDLSIEMRLEQVQGPVQYSVPPQGVVYQGTGVIAFRFAFERREDAMLFKLVWG